MVTIHIGSAQQDINAATESWLSDQIVRRKLEGQRVCVRIVVQTDRLNLTLATPGCQGGGVGRGPRPEEEKILELWVLCRLDTHHFEPKDLVRFLQLAGKLF